MHSLRRFVRKVGPVRHAAAEQGFDPVGRPPSRVDEMTTKDLRSLNELLPWACFTVDSLGRRVGSPRSATKRPDAQVIPDPRITRLNEELGLADKHVLEVGCFEGVHTIALCDVADRVTAVDGRVENVVKTLTRTWLYGHQPEVRLFNVEEPDAVDVYDCDVLHHNGVLYHLLDPVRHLRRALAKVRVGLLLDTHVSREAEATSSYVVDGETFRVKNFGEHPETSPFAGMYESARWLRLDDLRNELFRAGFENILVEELREERNGTRVLLIARR